MKTETKVHIIDVKDLVIGYKTKNKNISVAKNINLQLQKGHLISLVGANGIGKSTLLKTLIKMQPALAGKIHLNNKNLEQISNTDLAKQLSIVLTEQLPVKNLSVFELIALGRQPYTNWIGNLTKTDRSKIKNAIELVNIKDLQHKKCFELSDGQLQKVMIARALAQDTDIIVLDEPTTHLDMYHKVYILKLLLKLTKETGKTILFSTHEIDLAIQLSNTMVVMAKNEVHCDQPCKLIEQGVFNTLFPRDTITFDAVSGSFKVSK